MRLIIIISVNKTTKTIGDDTTEAEFGYETNISLEFTLHHRETNGSK